MGFSLSYSSYIYYIKIEKGAQRPTITNALSNATYKQGETADPLTVEATSPDNGTLTYQWSKGNGITGSPIAEATSKTYTPPTDEVGTWEYVCMVTNMIIENGVTKTATRTSSARITVKAAASRTDSSPFVGNPVATHLIVNPTENQTVQGYVGEKATFKLTLSPDVTEIRWFIDRGDGKGFVAIPGANGLEYTTAPLKAGNNGYRYYCAVSDGHYGQISPFFTLQVGRGAALPQTGDASTPMLWAAVAALSAAAFVLTARLRGRK